MFKRSAKPRTAAAQVLVGLVRSGDLAPLTEQVSAAVRALTKKGVVLHLASAFIGDMHVLMDVHNTTAKLVSLELPREGADDTPASPLMGEVVRFNRLEDSDGIRFEVELAWAGDPAGKQQQQRAIKQLTRLVKSRPQPEAT